MMVTVCLSAFVFAANAADKSYMTDEQYVQYKNTGGSINTILPINEVNPNSVVGLEEVDNANVNVNDASQEYNHNVFDDDGITELKVMVNNVSYPREPVEFNFTAANLNLGRGYQNLLNSKTRFG